MKPGNLMLLCLRMHAYQEKEDSEHVFADASEILRLLKPRNAEDYWLRGDVHWLRAKAREICLVSNPDKWIEEVTGGAARSRGYGNLTRLPDPFEEISADRQQALADYTEALRLDPANIDIYRSRARAYFEQDNFDKAIRDLSKVIRLAPNDPRAYCDRAEAYHEHGDPLRGSVSTFDKLRRDTRKEDYPLAIADYTQALRLKPGDAEILRKRGQLYLATHNYDKAIADCTESLRRQPNNADAYQTRLIAYRNVKDYDRALADCTAFIQLAPSDPDRQGWYGERASLYESKGDNVRALADYTKGIELQPGNASRYTARAKFFLRRGEFDRALADYSEAIRIDKNRENSEYWLGDLHAQRGRVYLRKGDLNAAEAEYTTAIKYRAKEGDHYAWRAWVRFCRGKREQALEDCEQAAERYEAQDNRRLVRAALLLVQGEYRQAIACFTPRKEQGEGMGSISGMGGMGGMPEPPHAGTPLPPTKPDCLRELPFPPPTPLPSSGLGSSKP
ncbi:MAG TPA: tetratricopeptide repeat protein [Gemmataceae bacterium]